MKWEINRKLSAALAISVIITLAINLLAFTSIRNLIESDRRVNHTYQAIEKSQAFSLA